MRRALLPSWARLISFPACVAASFVAFAAPGRAGDWYVDAQAADCVHADGSAAAPFCTISEAVNVAASFDTIHIAPGTYFELLTLDRSLTLVGTGGASVTTVDGGGLGSVVAITGVATVDLGGLTITHGKAHQGGGVNVGSGCTTRLTACVVTANLAEAVDNLGVRVPSDGGGIFSLDAYLTVAASTISDNFASAGGGGIHTEATPSVVTSSLTVTDSIVVRNVAGDSDGFYGWGGGIDDQWVGALRVSHTTFEANRNEGAGAQGGGGLSTQSYGVVLDHLVVRDNVSPRGGGILGWGGDVVVTDSLIEGNTADRAGGGAVLIYSSAFERCTVRGNRSSGHVGYPTYDGGGGIVIAGNVTDCLIENNTEDASGDGMGRGGGILVEEHGRTNLLRCIVRGNTASSSTQGGLGGGICFVRGPNPMTVADCAIVGNTATAADAGTAGDGGGICVTDSVFRHDVLLTRCTIAGNSAAGHDGLSAGTGGGISIDSWVNSVLSHVIVADNTCVRTGGAPDFSGTLQSSGYNLIGDTTGCTITGDGTGNQLDVDPLFADPPNGDFSLRSDSPAIDAGDPTDLPTGADVAGHPRVLDGNLDRAMVLDLGAFEFDHVNLAVSGAPTPGGVLTFTTTGTVGLPVFMCVGTASGELRIAPLGSLFIDLSSPWLILPWGTLPDQQSWTVDPALPLPASFILQPFAVDSASRTGNLGNAVRLDFE